MLVETDKHRIIKGEMIAINLARESTENQKELDL
jgi:hypothetical protein